MKNRRTEVLRHVRRGIAGLKSCAASSRREKAGHQNSPYASEDCYTCRRQGFKRTMDRKAHWERVYTTKASDEVSWFQPEPTVSLGLLERSGLTAAT